ncbi:hypothetical protein KQX54_008067 [Cotesia glomerata]|uniref:Uncharacterized protein n=1 Tax=Cotesia glomerata TaxID=32391 RepID=A0AAV7IY59_COTGL|nr:hypothetical protein KQX54_008067 [Cotesia glomerata]
MKNAGEEMHENRLPVAIIHQGPSPPDKLQAISQRNFLSPLVLAVHSTTRTGAGTPVVGVLFVVLVGVPGVRASTLQGIVFDVASGIENPREHLPIIRAINRFNIMQIPTDRDPCPPSNRRNRRNVANRSAVLGKGLSFKILQAKTADEKMLKHLLRVPSSRINIDRCNKGIKGEKLSLIESDHTRRPPLFLFKHYISISIGGIGSGGPRRRS